MPLKKPSDFFDKDPHEKVNISSVEISEENFDNVFNAFTKYKTYLDDFENKLDTINFLSDQLSSLQEQVGQALRKEDLDKVILSQLLYVNESISSIENNVKSINEEKLDEIREDSNYLLKKVETFIDEDIPKHQKRLVEFELKYDDQLQKSEEETKLTLSTISDLEEVFEKTVDETKEYFNNYDNRIEYIENYLKKSALGAFKKSLFEKVASIRDDVNINESKIRKQIREVEDVKKDIYEALENLKVESLQKEIESVRILNKDILENVGKVKEQSIDTHKEFSKKIADLEKLYEAIEINDKFLQEKVENGEESNDTSDPLTPLDQKFATLQDLQDHYRLFINRIQQQLSSLGGGGETRFEFLDDVDRDAIKDEGKLVFWDNTNKTLTAAPNITVGVGETTLLVEGDARVTGILTVGTESITLDSYSGRIASGDVEVVSPGGGARYTGVVTAASFSAGDGVGMLGITSTSITGPSTITIDPAAVGDNTGTVVIKGDLIVEGVETKIESQTLEVADKTIGIASTATKLNNSQLDGAGIIIHGSDSDKSLVWDNSNTRLSFNTDVYAPTYYGDGSNLSGIEAGQSPIGTPVGDPNDQSFVDGALGFTSETKIVNALDELNELALNMMNNTAVSQLDFSTGTTAGGSPFSITLTTSAAGTPNSYYIDWGDGNTETTTDSTPSHTYTQSNGGQFSIEMTASNTAGAGAGSSFTTSKSNYITVYTPDPVVSFNLYRNSTGGSILSGNDLYVIEGDSLYLDNNTTNTTSATVDYTMNWGDGSSNDPIANDAADGGVSGSRLQHTWGQSNSGTGRDTLTLTLNNHNTANPTVIPTNGTSLLKVYDDSPTAPDGLSTKTLSNVTSTGSSPKLAHGFTDNTGGSTITAGDSVVRVKSGTAQTPILSSFAYNADSGTLSAKVNGSDDGSITLSSADNSGTNNSLIITSESDYQLLNSSGSTVSFSNSTYYPGFAKGFKARVSKTVASMSTGANSYQLSHSSTGDTNVVEFVKDNLTSNPTVNIGSATLAENVAGTYRYISGVPYYNSGSPSLTLSGVTIDDLVGQCYTNQNDIVEVDNGGGSTISNSGYTYAEIDGSTTMLSGGIPKANTGTSSSYAIGSLTVPITSSSTRTVGQIKVRSKNVNGTSSYSSNLSTNIQVHKSAQSGISEIAIDVSNSLGSNYTDDGIRVYDFKDSTTDTPTYNGSTNFYTNNPYTESLDSSVVGTKESIIRLGDIIFDQTNFSSGYLPSGPNRSSAPSTQYFTFAFRRQTVANFDINITSSGIAGLWIAAPGTNIDSTSGLNGWLRADTAYAGSGTPGSGSGGNGSDGCALTTGDRILTSTSLSSGYTMTLGNENMSNATGNVVLVRIALNSGQSVTSLSIGVAA